MNNYDLFTIIMVTFILAAIVLVVIINEAKMFKEKSEEQQIANVKEWLLLAVTEAEKKFGSDMGKIKLRYVYDLAVSKFPIVKRIPFETFSMWVDEQLKVLQNILEKNLKVDEYVYGDNESTELIDIDKYNEEHK